MFGSFNDFEIISHVENVRYTGDTFYPCEISLYNGNANHGLLPHTYIRSKNVNICAFAARCQSMGVQINLIGKKFIRPEVSGIEFANVHPPQFPGFQNGFNNGYSNGFGRQF